MSKVVYISEAAKTLGITPHYLRILEYEGRIPAARRDFNGRFYSGARGEALARLERDRDALIESYAVMGGETLEELAPEERHRIYKLLRLGVRFRPDWPLEITGVFAEVGEKAEMSSSKCKLSPLSV